MNQPSPRKGCLRTIFIIFGLGLVIGAISLPQFLFPQTSPVPNDYNKLLGVETVLWNQSKAKDIHFSDPNNLCRTEYHLVSAEGVSMWTGSPNFMVKKGDKVEKFKHLDMEFLTLYNPSKSKFLLPLVRRPIFDFAPFFIEFTHHYEITSTLGINRGERMESATVWIPEDNFEGEIVLLVQSHPMNSGWRILTVSKDGLPALLKDGVKDILQLEKVEDSPDKDSFFHMIKLSSIHPFRHRAANLLPPKASSP